MPLLDFQKTVGIKSVEHFVHPSVFHFRDFNFPLPIHGLVLQILNLGLQLQVVHDLGLFPAIANPRSISLLLH